MTYRQPHEIATLAAWLLAAGFEARTASVIVARDAAIVWC